MGCARSGAQGVLHGAWTWHWGRNNAGISDAASNPFLGCYFVLWAAVTERWLGWKCRSTPMLFAGGFILGSFEVLEELRAQCLGNIVLNPL